MRVKATAGFTLLEILMVILLVGIVSAVAIPQFIDFRDDARAATTQERLAQIRSAILGDGRTGNSGYIANMGRVPANLTELSTQGAQAAYDPVNKRGWNGPYVDAVSGWTNDSWGTALVYNSGTRSLRSCGKNKVCNDADDITISF